MKTTPTHSSEEKATPISRTGSGWISISRSACLLAIPFSLLLGAGHAFGQGTGGAGGGHTWLGTSSTDFFDTANWNTGNWPNGIANYGPDGGANTTVVRSSQTYTYQYGIQFTNTTDTNGSYDISGTQAFDFRNFGVRTSTMSSGTLNEVIHNDIIRNGEYGYETGAGHDLTLNGVISSGTDLIKKGDGTLYLNGANTYTGATTINGGVLEVQGGAAIVDTGAVTVNSNGTFEVDNNETIGRIGGAGNVVLNANLTTGDTTNTEISGDISGSGGLVKQGASTLTLSGDNSAFSGGITVQDNGSRLALNSANAAGTGDLTFSGGTHLKFFNGASGPTTITNNLITGAGSWLYWESGSKALEITGDWSNSSGVVWTNSSETLTMSGVVSGTASTGFYGNGTIALTNANNTYTGNHHATLDSTIQFTTVANSGVNSALGAGTTIRFDGGNQGFSGYFENIGEGGSTDRAITIGSTATAREAGIANNGTGALNFSGTFTNNASGGGTRTLLLGGDYAGENTISSVLSDGVGGGKLALTKDGDTTWALSGVNTYTGGTTVNAGTLDLVGQGIIDGALTVDGSSSLVKLSATGVNGMQRLDSLTLSNGGTFTDNGPAGGLHSVNNSVTFDGGGTISSEVAGSGGFGNFLFIQGINVTGTPGLATIDADSISFNYGQTITVADSVAGSGTDLLISSSIRNQRPGTITKNGTGKVTLTGANVDTSAWAINDGTLEIGGSGVLQSGSYAGAIANSGTFEYNSTAAQTMSGVISGTGALVKGNSGTLTLSGTNTYTGTTTVDTGTLIIDGIQSSATGAMTINVNGTLAGSGTIGASLLTVNGVIAPGNSPGTLATGSQLWNDGGSYLWEINASNDAGGTIGTDPGWDWLDITGTLDLSLLSAGGFTIDIDSLTSGNIAGDAAGFETWSKGDGIVDYSFIIASASAGISGFDATDFSFDSSGFSNGPSWDWQIVLSGSDLVLEAYAVPEPSSTALLGLGGLALMLRRKRS